MNISKIQTTPNFYNTQKPQKREFIDIISDNVRNPRDVNDCVAVPRGIFKAYIYLMAGSGLISIANFLPQKWKSDLMASGSNSSNRSPTLTESPLLTHAL